MPDLSTTAPSVDAETLSCGIVMPISSIDGLGADHWADVKTIIQDAVDSIPKPKFHARLVSDADDVGVIQKRIVQGVYNADIIICDVSARNANVMFELGMRLAFDKPTIIIKDDKTEYSFDTSIIEHLPYPRDLRFAKIVAFKKQLADKVLATYQLSKSDPMHSTFLKNFGTFKVAQLAQTAGSSEQVIIEMLQEMQQEMGRIRRAVPNRRDSLMTTHSIGERSEEGRLRVLTAILKLRNEKPDLVLEPTDELISQLEGSLPAPNYFNNHKEFKEAVKDACAAIMSNA